MQGFKSFVDPVTIDLTDGITCIVGPNGSGKSNISDALRWVLGEQSPKQLRGMKMDEVIFSGTATRKPKGMAEVTLVIDNSSSMLPIEYSEVAVTRRMYRSGESEYLINGNICRLRDIKELFMDTGIGVDGYSIIGQGKIADIVSEKPESRREIFEEAAGVVLYKSRKAEAERKLKSATDNLDRVRDIISEIEGRIGGLKDESEKATEYLELRERNKHLGVNILLYSIDSLTKSLSDSEGELADIEKKLEEAEKASLEAEDRLERCRQIDAELSAEKDEKIEELREKTEELNTVSNSDKLNAQRLETIEKDLERLNKAVEGDTAKLAAEREEFSGLEGKERALNEEADAAKKRYDEAVAKLNAKVEEKEKFSSAVEDGKERMIEINNILVSKRAEIDTLDRYRNTLEERRRLLVEESAGRDETHAQNKNKLAEAVKAFEDKERSIADLREGVADLENKIISVNSRLREIADESDRISLEINRASARKSTIEEMENNYEGYSSAVRSLMREKIKGVEGIVSDLIEVPEGFELAVETALGPALQHVVCEDDDSAKRGVEWLKRTESGRATFLPVATIKARPVSLGNEIKNAKGYISLASEKVKCDGRYEAIVEYLLGRTILADDMDDAVRISKSDTRGCRIVTLDGEIINSSGAVTGGRYRNKTANLLERKKEIETLSDAVDEMRKKLASLEKDADKARMEIAELKSERADSYGKIGSAEVELGVLRSEKEHLESLIADADGASDRRDTELVNLDSDIERTISMSDDYKETVGKLEAESKELETEIETMLSREGGYDGEIEDIEQEVMQNRLAENEHNTARLGLNELIERVRDTISDLEYGIEENESEIEDLRREKKLLETSGEDSDAKAGELREEKKALEDRLKELDEAIEQNKMNDSETLAAQKECARKTESLNSEKYNVEIKRTRNETLFNTQKEKLWEDFEVSFAEACDMRADDFKITPAKRESSEIKVRMAELGDVNISSIEEYKQVSKRYEFMTGQERDITTAMGELEGIISNMDRKIKQQFKENFDKVVIYFEESFKALFGGGTAELRLEDENDPLGSGIEIVVQPPGKKLTNINLMSGGEKTLTAIALMFAVLKAKPTPFCILDEIEAALDDANIERFLEYLNNFNEVQFALITHQKATMERADVLYGITMPEQGISKILSLKYSDDLLTEK